MKVLLALMVFIAVGVAGIVVFIYSGTYDVSALAPDNAIVKWVAQTTSERSVGARLDGIVIPAGVDTDASLQTGAQLFGQNCVVCHGGPGLKPTAIAQGLNPSPPHDFFTPGRSPWMQEMFRFIKYGVKMTAMPGFGATYTDKDIWSIAAFLRKGPGMTTEEFARMTGIETPAATSPKPAGG